MSFAVTNADILRGRTTQPTMELTRGAQLKPEEESPMKPSLKCLTTSAWSWSFHGLCS